MLLSQHMVQYSAIPALIFSTGSLEKSLFLFLLFQCLYALNWCCTISSSQPRAGELSALTIMMVKTCWKLQAVFNFLEKYEQTKHENSSCADECAGKMLINLNVISTDLYHPSKDRVINLPN